MPKKFKLYTPETGVEYKFSMPETGKIVTFRYLCVTADGRLSFRSMMYGNVEKMTKERFSYLYTFCLIEKKKIKEGEKNGKRDKN